MIACPRNAEHTEARHSSIGQLATPTAGTDVCLQHTPTPRGGGVTHTTTRSPSSSPFMHRSHLERTFAIEACPSSFDASEKGEKAKTGQASARTTSGTRVQTKLYGQHSLTDTYSKQTMCCACREVCARRG